MPKSDLEYELTELSIFEEQQQYLSENIQTWRELLEDSKKGLPYKQVTDVLCNYTADLINKIRIMEDDLLPAFEAQISNNL